MRRENENLGRVFDPENNERLRDALDAVMDASGSEALIVVSFSRGGELPELNSVYGTDGGAWLGHLVVWLSRHVADGMTRGLKALHTEVFGSDADDNGGHRPGREQKPPGVPDRPLPQDDDENLPF